MQSISNTGPLSCSASVDSKTIANLYETIKRLLQRRHRGIVSECETGNRCWVSIILHPGMEASRGGGASGCHTRKLGLKIWRQLSRRADPASPAVVMSTSSSTTLAMEFCIALLPISFRRTQIRKVRCGQGKKTILVHTSSNFRTFLGVLTPSGIESDRSDRHGHSA